MTSRPLVLGALLATAGVVLLGCGGKSQTSDYVEKSKSAYDDLTASAVAISTRLASATAADIPKVSRAANSQLKLVSRADAKLRRIDVEAKERQAHNALTSGSAKQRDFLAAVLKASNLGQGAPPGEVSTMRRRAETMVDSYRRYVAIAPEADPAITNAGLVKSTAAYARVLRAPVRTSQGGGAPSGGSGGSTGFITASGKNACRAEGGGVYCSSNTSYAVYMGSSGPWEPVSANPPSALSSSTLGYGTTWRTPDGLISCVVQASGATGVYCSNVAGFGFRLWDGGLTNG